jgi:hypothetical protein
LSADDNEECYSNPKLISDFLLEPVFNQLGIYDVLAKHKPSTKLQYDLVGITKLLTYGRILDPGSKLRTYEHNENYLFPPAKDADLNHVYKSLDVLNILSDKIQTRMNTKITLSKKL